MKYEAKITLNTYINIIDKMGITYLFMIIWLFFFNCYYFYIEF